MVFRFALFFKLLGVIALCGAVSACGGGKKEKFAYVERPVELLYANAKTQLDKKRYETAIAFFEEVERQHPYSSWARRSMLMKAFAYYQGNDYEEAVTALDQFISLHPGNKDAAYAYYLKAMCYYERIRDIGRDQDFTNNAVAALTDVVRRYPDTEYARDARLKLDLTFDHLAGKEMYVGRFYLRKNKHIAAINRFKTVVEKYQTTNHAAEALHRLVEAYLELGIIDEARSAAAVLGYNYPGSRWYEDTYKLFAKRDILISDVRKDRRVAEAETVEDPNKILQDLDPDTVDGVDLVTARDLDELTPPSGNLGGDVGPPVFEPSDL
ncbi:competence lipoprotein ComL, putative [hydrothermal vent metagenome]|uniref:Competence lipoprotein ComL, putative n=1 Tax=hydrothermal vent metagenome TaxID=652676 RepID=A0A3B0RST8_9ZZZZ